MSNLYRKVIKVGSSHYFTIPSHLRNNSLYNRQFLVELLESEMILFFTELTPDQTITVEQQKNISTVIKFGAYQQIIRIPQQIFKEIEFFVTAKSRFKVTQISSPDGRISFNFVLSSEKEITEEFEKKTEKSTTTKISFLHRKKLEVQTNNNSSYIDYLQDKDSE